MNPNYLVHKTPCVILDEPNIKVYARHTFAPDDEEDDGSDSSGGAGGFTM